MNTSIYLTLDYELFFGPNSGTQESCMIKPTKMLLDVFDKYNIKATFFVDSGYILKLDEYRKIYGILENDYSKVVSQIRYLSECSHDIQLHIHPHWEDSYFDGARWVNDTSRFSLHQFSKDEIDDIVHKYKRTLTDIVGDSLFAYRAGGWCIQPFSQVHDALMKHNIWLDSTLFNGGFSHCSTHYFDFRNSPDKSKWQFDQDPLVESADGFFTEIPISSYKVSPFFFWKLAFFRKFGGSKHIPFGDGGPVGGSKWDKLRMLTKYTNSVVSIDGFKASYLEDAYKSFRRNKDHENFVIIGHPKAMSHFSLDKIEKFILNVDNQLFTTLSQTFNHE